MNNLLNLRQVSVKLGITESKLRTIVTNHHITAAETVVKGTKKYRLYNEISVNFIKKLIAEDRMIYKKTHKDKSGEPIKQKPIAIPLANGYQIFYNGDLKGFVLPEQLDVYRDKIEVLWG